jgi:NCS1 family nucleobase:cation symporter-1
MITPGRGHMSTYGNSILRVEPFGIEHIPGSERHGNPRRLFTLWFASNVTIGSYAVGYLAVSLFSLPILPSLIALLVGNLIGGILLGLTSSTGPSYGYPQMIITRRSFGRKGAYLPALLQWASTVGWFTVNAVLGSFAMNDLLHIGYVPSALILLAAMIIIGIYGHNFIHQFEKIMAVVLGLFFAVATAIVMMHSGKFALYHPSVVAGVPSFAVNIVLLAGASLSYLMSWGPYASDYSRYLREDTDVTKSFLNTFLGGFIASFWFEALGALIAAFVYGNIADPSAIGIIGSFSYILGSLGTAALVAVVLGTLSANALNIYTSALSSLVLDIRIRRWKAVLVSGIIGSVLTISLSGSFTSFYEGFLLLLDYWITPWLAIVLIDFFILGHRDYREVVEAPAVRGSGLLSYLFGLLCSVPFISWGYSNLSYTGYISANYLGGADISYYIALIVTGLTYYTVEGRRMRGRSGISTPASAK